LLQLTTHRLDDIILLTEEEEEANIRLLYHSSPPNSYEFKYTASRAVIGTPSFSINQMPIPGLTGDSDFAAWSVILDKMLTKGPPKLRASAPDTEPLLHPSGAKKSGGTPLLTVVGLFMMVMGMVAWMAAKRGLLSRGCVPGSDLIMEMRHASSSTTMDVEARSGERETLMRNRGDQ